MAKSSEAKLPISQKEPSLFRKERTLGKRETIRAFFLYKRKKTFGRIEHAMHARAIGDSSRRDFCQQAKSQQAIDANRRRAMLQQQHSIGDSSRRDMLQTEAFDARSAFKQRYNCNMTINSHW
ncbi:hypothetical protein COT30_05075 [Candidatus Micrarchaeota archaeon CG08_land_8_20_14_0_20_49_17]|nr:MAG: hypothetical protein AUJ13_04665 [Candidatus Micrarchaeota archaeon CG1_02_49_24]PIU09300.1 MAG: hypothetical protein COT30_05075 [Candidatus Micrarchaeota archaeon CG08_land_8_20_14_0_20_49_17]